MFFVVITSQYVEVSSCQINGIVKYLPLKCTEVPKNCTQEQELSTWLLVFTWNCTYVSVQFGGRCVAYNYLFALE